MFAFPLPPLVTYIFCRRNEYYSERLLSGSFDFAFFCKIFSFGKDVFLQSHNFMLSLNGVIEFAFKLFVFFFYFGITMTLVFNAFVKQEILRLIRSKTIW